MKSSQNPPNSPSSSSPTSPSFAQNLHLLANISSQSTSSSCAIDPLVLNRAGRQFIYRRSRPEQEHNELSNNAITLAGQSSTLLNLLTQNTESVEDKNIRIYRQNKVEHLHSYLQQQQHQQPSEVVLKQTLINDYLQPKLASHSHKSLIQQSSTSNHHHHHQISPGPSMQQQQPSISAFCSQPILSQLEQLKNSSTSKSSPKSCSKTGGQSLLLKSITKHSIEESASSSCDSTDKVIHRRKKPRKEVSLLLQPSGSKKSLSASQVAKQSSLLLQALSKDSSSNLPKITPICSTLLSNKSSPKAVQDTVQSPSLLYPILASELSTASIKVEEHSDKKDEQEEGQNLEVFNSNNVSELFDISFKNNRQNVLPLFDYSFQDTQVQNEEDKKIEEQRTDIPSGSKLKRHRHSSTIYDQKSDAHSDYELRIKQKFYKKDINDMNEYEILHEINRIQRNSFKYYRKNANKRILKKNLRNNKILAMSNIKFGSIPKKPKKKSKKKKNNKKDKKKTATKKDKNRKMSRRMLSKKMTNSEKSRLRELEQKFILKALLKQNILLPSKTINQDEADDIVGILLQLSIIKFDNITQEEADGVMMFVDIAKEKLKSFYRNIDFDEIDLELGHVENDSSQNIDSPMLDNNTKKPLRKRKNIQCLQKRLLICMEKLRNAQNEMNFSEKNCLEKMKFMNRFIRIFKKSEIIKLKLILENLNQRILILDKSSENQDQNHVDIEEFQKRLSIIRLKFQNFVEFETKFPNKNIDKFQAQSMTLLFQMKSLEGDILAKSPEPEAEKESSMIKFELTCLDDSLCSTELLNFDFTEYDEIIDKSLEFIRQSLASIQHEKDELLRIKNILTELSKNEPALSTVAKNIRREELLEDYRFSLTRKYSENSVRDSLKSDEKLKLSLNEKALLFKISKNPKKNNNLYRKYSQKNIDFYPDFDGDNSQDIVKDSKAQKNVQIKNRKKKEIIMDQNKKNQNKVFEKTVRGLSFIPKFGSKSEEEMKKNQVLNTIKRSIVKRMIAKNGYDSEFVKNGKKRVLKKVDNPEKCVQNDIKKCIESRRLSENSSSQKRESGRKNNKLSNKIFYSYLECFRLKLISKFLQISNSFEHKFDENQIDFLTKQFEFETQIKRTFLQIQKTIVNLKKQNRKQEYSLILFHRIKNNFVPKNCLIETNKKNNNDLKCLLPKLSEHFHQIYLENLKGSKESSKGKKNNDEIEDSEKKIVATKDEQKTIRSFIESDLPGFCIQVERLLIKKSLRRAGIPFNPYLFPGICIEPSKIERQSAFRELQRPLIPCVHSSLFLKMVNYQSLLDHEHIVFLCSKEADSVRPDLLFCYERSCTKSSEKSLNILICLTCGGLFCGDKAHSRQHFQQTKHCFALNITNSFLYCYLCNKFIFDYDLDPTVKLLRESLVPIWKQNLIYHWEKRLWHYSTGEYYPELRLFRLDFSHTKLGFTGLFNLGSTCFMNSIIHTLVHASGFREYLLTQTHRCPEGKFQSCIGCEFSQMAFQLYFGSRFPVIPARFYDLVWANIPHLAFYGEQDAHEFFTSILDVLHEHYKAADGEQEDKLCQCIVHKLFYGVLQSELICQTCGTVRTNDEMMMGFNLDLKDQSHRPAKNLRTLEDCLNLFTKLEDLGPDMLLTCDSCDYRRQTSKRLKIKHLPPIIGFQFKRFEQVGLKSLKIPHKVTYSLDMDLSKFVDDIPEHEPNYQYTLYAVVNHIGSLHSGHYTASIRSDDGHWYLFNDEYVERISQNAVLNNMNAYMVFYKRKNMAVRMQEYSLV